MDIQLAGSYCTARINFIFGVLNFIERYSALHLCSGLHFYNIYNICINIVVMVCLKPSYIYVWLDTIDCNFVYSSCDIIAIVCQTKLCFYTRFVVFIDCSIVVLVLWTLVHVQCMSMCVLITAAYILDIKFWCLHFIGT